jgi:hypothetical protein
MHAQTSIIGLFIGSIGCNVGAKKIICIYCTYIVGAYIAVLDFNWVKLWWIVMDIGSMND